MTLGEKINQIVRGKPNTPERRREVKSRCEELISRLFPDGRVFSQELKRQVEIEVMCDERNNPPMVVERQEPIEVSVFPQEILDYAVGVEGMTEKSRTGRIQELANALRVPADILGEGIQAVVEEIQSGKSVTDIIKEPPPPDPLNEYHPWLREGQAWVANGDIGYIAYIGRTVGWEFRGRQDTTTLQEAGGRPIGTIWDVLPTAVCTVRVTGGKVVAYKTRSNLWHNTYPALHTVLPNGEHNRPAWAQAEPSSEEQCDE